MYNTKYTLKEFSELPNSPFYINGENVIDKETNKTLCTVKYFLEMLRRKTHCNFETVYYCHATLEEVLRCKDCGTIIFASDDCWEYEPNLCCPTCSNYTTNFEYWTAEDIANSEEKQSLVKNLEKMAEEDRAESERYKKRGKYDYQIWKGSIKISKKHALFFDLECDNLFKSGLKGLHLVIHTAEKDDISYVYKKVYKIPLSYSYLKLYCYMKKKEKEMKNK